MPSHLAQKCTGIPGGCPVPSPTSASYPQVACWRVPCSKADAACHPHATSLRLEMYGHPWRAPCNQDGAQLTQGAPVHHLSMMYGRPLQAPISCTGAARLRAPFSPVLRASRSHLSSHNVTYAHFLSNPYLVAKQSTYKTSATTTFYLNYRQRYYEMVSVAA